jgi:UDP-2,3-diacylglucosamine pyrophosphatase LpxH
MMKSLAHTRLQEAWKNTPPWRRVLWLGMVVAGTLALVAALLYIFSFPSTIGFYRVNGAFRPAFWLVGGLAALIPLLAALDLWIQARRKRGKPHLPGAGIWVISGVGLFLAVALFLFLGTSLNAGPSDQPPQLLLTEGSSASGAPNMAVAFWTSQPSQHTLQWGKAGESRTLAENMAQQEHAFMLRELEADSDYWYQVDQGPVVRFRTPPGEGEPLRFAVGADVHFGSSSSQYDLIAKMLNQIGDPAHGFSFFFLLGDIVDYGFSNPEWNEASSLLAPTTGQVPFRPLLGNHDTLFGGEALFQRYYYPTGMDLKEGSRQWFRVDNGRVHFLCLDLEWSAESLTPEQLAWLEKQLASIPAADWTVVLGHGFTYASGNVYQGWDWYDNPETIALLVPLFEKYDVDLALAGHAHHLEVLEKNGVTYAICGSFGCKPDTGLSYQSPFSIWSQAGPTAFLDISLGSGSGTLTIRDPDFQEIKSFPLTP